MGVTTKATQKRSPPLSLRSQKSLPRQSPQSRLRSRSYSHDNELYRMGLRKNAAGEWTETDNLPTAGIAAAMRSMRMKREMSVQSDGRDKSVDMEDSTAVFEEIVVYMEITGSRDSELVDIDGDTNMEEAEEIMQSVEAKIEFKGEVKVEPDSDEQALETLPVIREQDEMVAKRERVPILSDALAYLDQVKSPFIDTPEVYQQFLHIMQNWQLYRSMSQQELYVEVTRLFSSTPELLEGFDWFFSEDTVKALKKVAPNAAPQETSVQTTNSGEQHRASRSKQ